jgi:PIN domain nuclease of toxin-antitoxin system
MWNITKQKLPDVCTSVIGYWEINVKGNKTKITQEVQYVSSMDYNEWQCIEYTKSGFIMRLTLLGEPLMWRPIIPLIDRPNDTI